MDPSTTADAEDARRRGAFRHALPGVEAAGDVKLEAVGFFDTPLGRIGIVLNEAAEILPLVLHLRNCVLVIYPCEDKVEWDRDMMQNNPQRFAKIWTAGFAKRQQNLRLLSVQLRTSIL